MSKDNVHDYDWIVIGSGFGGSVSALRLAEKGYRVAVLECGRRFEDHEFAKTTWNWRRYLWVPRLGGKGILRMSIFKDVAILSGCGVGGGSLGYANTLYRAPSHFFRDEQWAALADWEDALAPHYETAERMLGVTRVPDRDPGDEMLRELGRDLGVEDTHSMTNVGVFFGDAGETVPDPYFGGEGPNRTGCVRCGGCMIGCRFGAKNTLVKNYLHLAERRGVRVFPERMVVNVGTIGPADGSGGYKVTSERSGRWLAKDRHSLTADGVVFAAGALGTNHLLQNCRARGALPRISHRLGYLVRTNSEAILAVTAKDEKTDFSRRVAITSSIYPAPDTHIETVTYGGGGSSMSFLFTVLVGPGTRFTRPLAFLREVVANPRQYLQTLVPGGWSKRTLILLVMQTLDNSMRLRARQTLFGRGVRLQTEQDPDNPNPTYIEAANDAAKRIADKLEGIPQSSVFEALANIPSTAHVLGGAVIGKDYHHGVVDPSSRIYGYENLLVCDGAAVPANPGVNPSLTITALAEHAMGKVPPKEGAPDVPQVQLTAPVPEPQTTVVPETSATDRQSRHPNVSPAVRT
jgi:cholesterol oxidase